MWSLRTSHRTLSKALATLGQRAYAGQSVAALQKQLDDFYMPPRLAGRPFLPGSESKNMPQVVAPPRRDFPLRCTASNLGFSGKNLSPRDMGARVGGRLQEDLLKYGALLIDADVGLRTRQDLSEFLKGVDWPEVVYTLGTGIRKAEGERLLSASDEPPEYSIELHNEMSYTSGKKPNRIGFFCVDEADYGGETVICDVREIWKQLDKQIVAPMCERGIRYHWWDDNEDVPNPYRTWKKHINVDSREEAENLLRKNNYGWEWLDVGLSSWVDRPAMHKHPITGEYLWFNQSTANHQTYFQCHPRFFGRNLTARRYPATCFYPEWDEIPAPVLQHIRDVSWNCAVGFKMKPGELVLLDNFYVQHARLGFKGNRKLVVTLID